MRRIEMIGSPLDHVRSPDLLNAMFRARGEDVEVIIHELRQDYLAAYAADVATDASMIGLVVTTPLKQAVTEYLADRTALVSLLGACNCVRFDKNGWLGANFDGLGFLAALAGVGGERVNGMRVLLVGCGGAGGAIAASLLQSAHIALALRDVDGGKALGLSLRLAEFAPDCEIGTIDAPDGVFDLVINASPVGMGEGDPSPIPEATVASAAIVADIVTVPNSALKLMAATLEKPVLTGDAMVAGQAGLLRGFLLGSARSESDVVSAGNLS